MQFLEEADEISRTANGNIQINRGRWTKREKRIFEESFQKHGKEWKLIASLIKTRTVIQIRTHAQKYFQKLAKQTGGPVMSTSKKEDLNLATLTSNASVSSSEFEDSEKKSRKLTMGTRKSPRRAKRRRTVAVFDEEIESDENKKMMKSDESVVSSSSSLSQVAGSEADVDECMVEKEFGVLSADLVPNHLIAAATLLVAPKFCNKISERRLRWAMNIIAEEIY